MFVLAIGNAFDGLTLYGPFDDAEEVSDYGEMFGKNDDWNVVPINETSALDWSTHGCHLYLSR